MRPGGAPEYMSSTHLSLHLHVIFGTKDQRPLIESPWRDRLHAYLGGAAKTLDIVPEAVAVFVRPSTADACPESFAAFAVADMVSNMRR